MLKLHAAVAVLAETNGLAEQAPRSARERLLGGANASEPGLGERNSALALVHGALAHEDDPCDECDREHDVEQPTVMSTQKLPMVGEFRREKPRTMAMATAMPMIGLIICCSVSAPIWEKYDMVVSPP